MPVGAVVGSAVVGAGASMASASSQKKAANKATEQAAQNNAANNALQREMYGSNLAILDPFRQEGLKATRTLSELLGLSPPGSAAAPAAAPAQGGYAAPTQYGAPVYANDGSGNLTPDDIIYRNGRFSTRDGLSLEAAEVREIYANQRAGQQPANALQTAPPPAAGPGLVPASGQPPRTGWDIFRDSTNYKFRFDEGSRAINQGYAAGGKLESGAALKALTKYGQDFASNELNNYIGLLGNQQGVGLNAARAVAGVGGDMANNITANNNAGTSAAMNAALLKGNANSQMIGDIGASFGRALGALGGSSYTPVNPSMSFQMPYGGNVTIPGL